MQCPRCELRGSISRVQCPECHAEYSAGDLEKLNHLYYLRWRLEQWQHSRTLPGPIANYLLALADVEVQELEWLLGAGRSFTLAPVRQASGVAPSVTPVPVSPVLVARPMSAHPTVPLGPHTPAGRRAAVLQSLTPTPVRPSKPPRPAFSWKQVGEYLLSERVLNGLLGIGSFLILAAACVISIANPTGLDPLWRLMALLATTLVVYGAGAFLQQRLKLVRTGAAVLAIGAAFIPLDIHTLGRQILGLDTRTIWLAASVVSLPAYFASHVWLRDRAFALLTAVAGGSLLLSALLQLGLAPVLGFGALIPLAAGYLVVARRVQHEWPALSWALFWAAQVATPVALAVLLALRFADPLHVSPPQDWQTRLGAQPGAALDYAVGIACWLGTAFYALAARTFGSRLYAAVAAWLCPVAYLFTLTKAPIASTWYGLCLTALAAAYLLAGRFTLRLPRRRDGSYAYEMLARQPVFQVAFALTVLAGLWPFTSFSAQIATLLSLTVVYGSAAFLLRQRAWAYVSIYLLVLVQLRQLAVPRAISNALNQTILAQISSALGFALLSGALLVVAEIAARRTGEARRPLLETAIGLGAWRSLFAAPLFSAGYLSALIAAYFGLSQYLSTPLLSTSDILGLLGIVAIACVSSIMRRSSVFLYPASALFLVPFIATAARLHPHPTLIFTSPEAARLMAIPALGYLGIAALLDRAGGHYARPIYLASYALSFLCVGLAAPDRAITVQVLGVSLLIYAISAVMVHRDRHPSYQWAVRQLFLGVHPAVVTHAGMLFLYLVAWLFPAWLVLAQSLRYPAPTIADYGLALALLAPLYAALALLFRRVRGIYAWPWLLSAYTLSAFGPLAAATDPALGWMALSFSITLYIASAVQSRRPEWLYPVAVLGPVLLWQVLDRYGDAQHTYGQALVLLSLAYGCLTVILHRGGAHDLLAPIRGALSPFAQPFFAIGQTIGVIGLLLVAQTGDAAAMALGFALGALGYGGAAYLSRRNIFNAPLAIALAVVYCAVLALASSPGNVHSLALLPGLLAYMAIGELFRRGPDAAAVIAERRRAGHYLSRWATPFNLILHLGAVVAFLNAVVDGGTALLPLTWLALAALYGVLTYLRHWPGPLYPAIGLAIAAYVSTLYLAAPGLGGAGLAISLAAPVWALCWLAHILSRIPQTSSTSRPVWFRWAGDPGPAPWARPLLSWGMLGLAGSTLACSANTTAALTIAAAYLVLLGTLGSVRRSEAAIWASVAFAAMAYQAALTWAGIAFGGQPPFWSVGAALAGALGLLLSRRRHPIAALWTRPLRLSGGAVSMLSLALSVAYLGAGQATLHTLAITMIVSAITLIAQGIVRRDSTLTYLGVALLDGGVLCEMAFHHVAQLQAYAAPIGITLLVLTVVEWRREPGSTAKVALEVGALVLLPGTAFWQALGGFGTAGDHYAYATLLLLEAVTLFCLGALVHWKRTFFAAGSAIVVDVFILLANPLQTLSTWYLVGLIGCLMVGLVVFLEQRRQQIPLWLDHVRLRLEAWD